MSHRFDLRVYYEDTDLAGIVYYANYFKFTERARSEYLRELGVDQKALKDAEGIVFAVRRVEADYVSAAQFDDQLVVDTSVEDISGARITLAQDVWRDKTLIFASRAVLVCLSDVGQPTRIPADVRRAFGAQMQ